MKLSFRSTIAILLCVVMITGVVLTGCDEGKTTPSDASESPTESTEIKEPKEIAATDIALNVSTLSLTVGNTSTLTATVSPADATDKSVSWTSSDTEIATVSDGTVTAVSAGTATITVKTKNGKTATCMVMVVDPPVYVKDVLLNISALTLTVGNTYALTATVSPDNATDKVLTWTSSDTAVAIVSNGTVFAVRQGTAVIIATTANGNTATCTVTVEEEIVESGLIYELTNDESYYVVTGYYGNAKEYTVPASYDGMRVIGISEGAFKNNNNLQKITISANIESIGSHAFRE